MLPRSAHDPVETLFDGNLALAETSGVVCVFQIGNMRLFKVTNLKIECSRACKWVIYLKKVYVPLLVIYVIFTQYMV